MNLMEYLLIALVVSLAWHIVRVLSNIIEELLVRRMRTTKWFDRVVSGKPTVKRDQKKGGPYSQTKIGFTMRNEGSH